MTKQELFDLFDGKISKVAMKPLPNTEFHPFGIFGKYCEIEYLGDGWWDLYLRNRDSPNAQLSGRRINQFMEKFNGIGVKLVKLDGEAYCQGKLELGLKQAILAELKWLGIRKSVNLTPEARQKLADRMKAMTEARQKA